MKKGQLELWMLTKMAMIFFIVALSLIILNISNIEKGGLCKEQATAKSRLIAASINQVITGSTEDEILTYKFDPTLAAGGEKSDRYLTNLTFRALENNKLQFDIKVAAINDRQCEGTATVFLDTSRIENDIKFQSSANYQARIAESEDGKTMTLLPSNAKIGERTRFLVISKCTAKTFGSRPHLTFTDCGGNILDPTNCADKATLLTCN